MPPVPSRLDDRVLDDVMNRTEFNPWRHLSPYFVRICGCLLTCPLFTQIPEINYVGIDSVRPGTLVRFRCMVQDLYNPEFYIGAFKDASTGGRWKTTKFTEDIELKQCIGCCGGESSQFHKIWERRVFFCVPIPGESEWLRCEDAVYGNAPPRTSSKVSEFGKIARQVGNDECDDSEIRKKYDSDIDLKFDRATKFADSEGNKVVNRTRRNPAHVTIAETLELAWNLPLGSTGHARATGKLPSSPCIVKVYGEECEIKLNDVVEFVGVLSIAPRLDAEQERALPNSSLPTLAGADDVVLPLPVYDFMEEGLTNNPPTSVVPRFHAIVTRILSIHDFAFSRSLVPTAASAERRPVLTPEIRTRGAELRAALIRHLAPPLGNDIIAAEFVLYALLSRVHTRIDAYRLGKFSVTLLGAPEGKIIGRDGKSLGCTTFAYVLASAISDIAPAVAVLPLSIDSLNSSSWLPKKDYKANRLRTGPLQLASGTCLVLDETMMSNGCLCDVGVRNVHALNDFIIAQEVDYDFEYHQIRVPVYIPTIIVSSASTKSVVAETVARVPLRMIAEPRAPSAVSRGLLTEMREFIAAARGSEHVIGRDVSAAIEDQLVGTRQREDDNKASENDFHRWLTTARLTALSMGETDLNMRHWSKVMDSERIVNARLRAC